MSKIIAVDLDGTLVNKEGQVSIQTIDYIKKIQSLGHKIIIATGRTLAGAMNIYNELCLKTPIIVNNGAMIFNPQDKTFQPMIKIIDSLTIHSIFKEFKEYILSAYYSIDDVTYAYNYDEKIEKSFNGVKNIKVVEGSLTEFQNDANVLVFSIKSDKKYYFEKTLKNKYEQLDFRIWSDNNQYTLYEIFLEGVSKYTGLLEVFKYYKLDKVDYIAFGDYYNDIDMIKHANPGIAVKNAVKPLKDVAIKISEYTNNEDAVYRELKKIIII